MEERYMGVIKAVFIVIREKDTLLDVQFSGKKAYWSMYEDVGYQRWSRAKTRVERNRVVNKIVKLFI